MSNFVFPLSSYTQAKGLAWNIKRRPTFSTIVQTSTNGREVRAQLEPFPRDEFELTFTRLPEGGDFDTLIGFYKARGGSYDSFLLTLPSDSIVVQQPIGNGDGVTVNFPMSRAYGAFSEPIENCAFSAIWVNSVLRTTGLSVNSYKGGYANQLSFTGGAPVGLITASFTYSFRVRFKDDQNEFNNFLYKLWELQTITFKQVKL